MKYKAVIFDMDGTILDTVSDLMDAINHTMELTGHRHDYDYETTKLLFGSGVKVAFERALALENGAPLSALEAIGQTNDGEEYGVTESELEKLTEIYLPYYNSHCLVKTGPYPGINELIAKLREENLLTAVVSNKPEAAVTSLVDELFTGLFDYSAGEKPGIKRKPAPDMVQAALDFFGVSVSDAVYIGDSEIDMLTAANSGLDCICVDWGFRGRTFLTEHNAENIVSDCDELFALLTRA